MKHFKIISLALVICMLASLISCFVVSADTSDVYCLADLRFTQSNETLTLDGAHVVAETVDGAVTIELDAATATVNMTTTNSINVLDTEKHPYFVFDFAGDVKVDSMIAHYTRKDKEASGKFADLYLNSMLDMADYQVGTVYKDATSTTSTRAYGIWDWGKYLCPDPSNPPTSKVFDDGIHSFKDVTCTLSGEVGKRITFYKFGVYCTTDNAILKLGENTAEATAPTLKDYCLADLRFNSTNDTLALEGAKVVAEKDGVITLELTAETATVNMTTTNSINILDPKKHPYFVFDFAGDVKVDSMIAHYTRKDKEASGKFADLYLNSMLDMADYQVGTVYKDATSTTSTRAYGIWDWGKYLCPDPSNPPTSKVFDDGIHSFKDVTCTLSGEVGKRITFYKFGVYCTTDNELLQLGESCGEADMLAFKVSHVNEYSYGAYESIILTGDGKTVKEQCGFALDWWNVFQIENVDGEYTVTKVYKADGVSKGDVTIPAGGFMLCVHSSCDASKFGNDLLGYRFYDLEGILEETSMKIDTTMSPAMNIYARAALTVDGTLTDKGWDAEGWTSVKPGEGGTWQGAPAEGNTNTVSFDYQIRKDDTKLYIAAVFNGTAKRVANDATNANGNGTNFRFWLHNGDPEATVYTHFIDACLHEDGTTGFRFMMNTLKDGNKAGAGTSKSLDAVVTEKDGKTYCEISIDLEDLQIPEGKIASVIPCVSNSPTGLLADNLCLFAGEITAAPEGATYDSNFPYHHWFTDIAIEVNDDIAIGAKPEAPKPTIEMKDFFVSHYNDPSAEGAGVIFTATYTGGTYWLHVAFKPVEGKTGVYEVVQISDGITNGGSGVPLAIPEGGFVYAINTGNNWGDLVELHTAAGTLQDQWWYAAYLADNAYYTTNFAKNPAVLASIEIAKTMTVGTKWVFTGIDFEGKTVPTTTPDLKWYDDNYVCTAKIGAYVEGADIPADEPVDDPSTDPSDDPSTDPSDEPSTEPSDDPTFDSTYTIDYGTINTRIDTGAVTVVTDLSDGYIDTYNLKWCGCLLLAPTDQAGVYTVVEAKPATPTGLGGQFDSEIKQGYIILAIHGQSNTELGDFRDKWTALAPSTKIVFNGYDFAAGTVADGATINVVAEQTPDVPATGDNGIFAIVILAVVALLGSAVVIRSRH